MHARARQADEDAELGRRPLRRGGAAVAADVVLGFGLDRDELINREGARGLARWSQNRQTRAERASEIEGGGADVLWTASRDRPPTWPWKPSWATSCCTFFSSCGGGSRRWESVSWRRFDSVWAGFEMQREGGTINRFHESPWEFNNPSVGTARGALSCLPKDARCWLRRGIQGGAASRFLASGQVVVMNCVLGGANPCGLDTSVAIPWTPAGAILRLPSRPSALPCPAPVLLNTKAGQDIYGSSPVTNTGNTSHSSPQSLR